jgi:glutathione synthase/RimK-type ligase-like ATP-grasp enzyme
MKIAILTCEKCPALAPRDLHLLPLFANRNVQADVVIWNDPAVDWRAYDGLLFRSVWDYHLRTEEFNNWLNHLAQLNIKTLNPVETIRQNQHKFYLRELESKGIEIIPTVFIDKTDTLDFSIIKSCNWPRAVIKPAVSASSYLTTLFDLADWQKIESEYQPVAAQRDLLLQPYMPEIKETGELSLVFFNRKYSHAVIKRAPQHDFRVQAEYGGEHFVFNPEKEVIETAENIISLVKGPLLYARVDGLLKNRRFVLMELELLEPDLYFDAHPEASERYVDGVVELIGE